MKQILLVGLSLIIASCTTLERSRHQSKREVKDQTYTKSAEDSTMKKRLLMLPFLDADPVRVESIRLAAYDAFLMDLNSSGKVVAVTPTSAGIDPQKYVDAKGNYKLSEVSKEAFRLGVSGAVEGKLIDIRIKRKADSVGIIRQMKSIFEVVIQMRVATGKSGNEVFNTVKTVTLEEANYRVAERVETDKNLGASIQMIEVLVKDAFLEFTPQVISSVERVVWEGRIAAINGDRIYINVGKISGVQIGDLLKVSDEVDDIYDPESGTHLGKVPGRLKGTIEVVSFFGNDGAIAVIHSGSGFKENDRIELY